MKEGRKSLRGSFSPLASYPLKMHPGVALLCYLSFMVFFATLCRFDWTTAAVLWGMILFLPRITTSKFYGLIKRMAAIFTFLLLALSLHAFFTPGTILWHTPIFNLTKEGLIQGVWIAQKLAAFFWISFAITASIPSLFLFQCLGALKRSRLFRSIDFGAWIIALFLITRWLLILPSAWKKQLAGAIKSEPVKIKRIFKGLRLIPQVLGKDLRRIRPWIDLLVLRGYAEGALWISDTPLPRLTRKDKVMLGSLLVAWGGWAAYLL